LRTNPCSVPIAKPCVSMMDSVLPFGLSASILALIVGNRHGGQDSTSPGGTRMGVPALRPFAIALRFMLCSCHGVA
jgi:hypothetical protein